jgi:SAM-dependent methyltransferase
MDYNEYAKIWQSKKSSGNHYAHQYIEKPSIYKLLETLPPNLRILDLGCGSGEDIQKLNDLGHVCTGIDSSNALVELASFNTNQNCYSADISKESWEDCLGGNKFDLVFSSLTFHYIEDWEKLLTTIKNKVLNKNGYVLFSCHHPIKWGSLSTKSNLQNSFILGYEKNKDSSLSYKVYGDYLNGSYKLGVRKIEEKLFNQLDITHYSRSISTMFKTFKKSEFEVIDFEEPIPIEDIKDKPDFYDVHNRIPLFCVFLLKSIEL